MGRPGSCCLVVVCLVLFWMLRTAIGSSVVNGVCSKTVTETRTRNVTVSKRVTFTYSATKRCPGGQQACSKRGHKWVKQLKPQRYTAKRIEHFCCSGFVAKSNGVCSPVCSPECLMGTCVSPNSCICNEGYRMNTTSHQCEPHCEKPCYNGVCISPDKCQCHEGFQKKPDEPNACIPTCAQLCINSKCTAPDICTCDSGYEPTPGDQWSCKPAECDAVCQMGECLDKHQCKCMPGCLSLDDFTNYTCDSRNCVNGKCNATYDCVCDEGLVLPVVNIWMGSKCEPVCDPICSNATCTSADTCTCLPGYEKHPHKSNECLPSCTPPCSNGVCVAPEKCLCDSGFTIDTQNHTLCIPHCVNSSRNGSSCICYPEYNYIENSATVCRPMCSQKCSFGKCVASETCQCYDNYTLSLKDKYQCDPVCQEECKNSECVKPGVCKCHDLYVPDPSDSSNCLPTCDPPCLDGVCRAPGSCECHSGYELDAATGRCAPLCSKPCVHGICIFPEICSCDPGFVNDHEEINKCVPQCSGGCKNGHCIAPETCECFEKFSVSESKNACEPICWKGCKNGKCVTPDVCECDDGYVEDLMNPNTCKPYCEDPCENGNCTSPGECSCLDGYEQVNSTSCQPHCDNCLHGKCINPGECVHAGDLANTGGEANCSADCRECKSGVCADPQCECNDSINQTRDGSTCLSLCDVKCVNGSYDRAAGVCTCEAGLVLSAGEAHTCVPALVACSLACPGGACSPEGSCLCHEEDDCFVAKQNMKISSISFLMFSDREWLMYFMFTILGFTFIVLGIHKFIRPSDSQPRSQDDSTSDWRYKHNTFIINKDIVKKADTKTYNNPMYSATVSKTNINRNRHSYSIDSSRDSEA